MIRTRLDKRNDFDEFYDKSEKIFKDLRDNDKRADKFESEYMLSVCPGSRNGGTDKRVIEVFWGLRQYDFETQGRNWKALTETGSSLLFYRNDTGDITISIYPAYTEQRKPFETSITLHIWLDPNRLKREKFVLTLWNDFMAYMECTSLDGNPTIWQRLRISYLRTFKHLVIDNKWMPTKFSNRRNKILDFLLTVGLSGFVFFLITFFSQPSETKIETQLKMVNKNLENVSTQLDRVYNNGASLEHIFETIDSLNLDTKHILERIEKQKPK
jgi:hypothetical protein